MKIDAHQHFWMFNETDFGWIGEDMESIRKDHLPDDLYLELTKAGFNGSIAVQARQSMEETRWLLQLAERYSFIRGVVGWVDFCLKEVDVQLENLAFNSKLVGVRHVIQDEPDENFILRPDFMRGIGQLRKYDLAYDILIHSRHLPQTAEFVSKFPAQTFILDHIAKPDIKNKIFAPWKAGMAALSKFPNVYVKLSGMATEAEWQTWKGEDFIPYLDAAMELFGPARLMIGSDWPVCTLAGSYDSVMGIVLDYIDRLSENEQAAILGGTASGAYRI